MPDDTVERAFRRAMPALVAAIARSASPGVAGQERRASVTAEVMQQIAGLVASGQPAPRGSAAAARKGHPT